jgi:hypothetical protein
MVWYLSENSELGKWVPNLPDCPCTIPHNDPKFSKPRNIWDPRYHPGGDKEIRSEATAEGAAQQCVYDNKGCLITEGLGAGTADRRKSGFPLIAPHLNEDVTPFELALELDGIKFGANQIGTFTQMYLKVRPINNGNNCPANPGPIKPAILPAVATPGFDKLPPLDRGD